MKNSLACLILLTLASCLWAQTPQKMSYQAVTRNESGQLIANKQIGMQISILQSSENGSVVYSETHTPTTNENGLTSIEIGAGNPVIGTLDGVDWSKGTFFIKTETDPTGGSTYTITGTSQLQNVPYALHAKTTESMISLTDNQRDAILQPREGLLIFNVTTKSFNVYKNGNWYEWQATDCVPRPTIANAGIDQDVTPQITTTTLEGNTPVSGMGTWSIVSGNGGVIADANNPVSSFSGKNGAHTLRWSIATSCNTTTDEVTINIVDNCSNGVKDGAETDVDCGGASCSKCNPEKICLANSDCSTNNCTRGTCRHCPIGLFYDLASNTCLTQCPAFKADDTCVITCPAKLFIYGKECLTKCPQGKRVENNTCVDPLK